MSLYPPSLVRDCMTSGVVSITPETPLPEVQVLLENHSISAVAVIDAAGMLVGVVSVRDLLRKARVEMDERAAEVEVKPMAGAFARDVMREGVRTVEETAPMVEAARCMLEHQVHRLFVTRDKVPVGVLSTRDAMKMVVAAADATPLSALMTSPVETIDLGTPADEAVRRLDTASVRGLVVVDGDWPIGVFTHTEALASTKLPASLQTMPVERLMSYETICLDVATPAYRVASYARQLGVRRILAVQNRDLVGIATGIDLLKLFGR